MERNFRKFAESLSNEEYTLFNINDYWNPKMTTKFKPERAKKEVCGRSIV
jgi:hypothetical protein